MNRTLPFALGAAVLCGCHPPPEFAPKGLEEASIFLFQEFETTDEDIVLEYNAAILDLQDLLGKEDLQGDIKDRQYTLQVQEDFGDLKIPSGASADKQVNRAVAGYTTHEIDEMRPMHLDPNQICIESSSTIWAGRTVTAGGDCWEDGCERLETENEVRKQNILAKVWYDQYKDYRTITVEDAEGETFEVIIARAWIDKVFEADGGGGNSWDQLFQLDAYIPNPDKPGETYRWFAMWSSITLGGLSDDAYGNLVVEGIDEAYIYADEYVEGKIGETCKNDRDEPKPERN